MQNVPLPSTHSSDSSSSSVCSFMCHCLIHLPSYMLQTGPGRTDGREVYDVIRYVPIIVVFGVGTQQSRSQ